MASSRICSVEGCDKPHVARDFCSHHYDKFKNGPEFTRAVPKTVCSVDGCLRPHKARGLCGVHYSRFRNSIPLDRPWLTRPGEALAYVDKILAMETDDCVTWPFGRSPSGYGYVTDPHHRTSHIHVSRLVCEIKYGPAPSDFHEAAHNCGNGHLACCNWRHVRWATPKENQADKVVHGTHNRGERSAAAKLTANQVREIRQKAVEREYPKVGVLSGLAQEYKVGSSNIHAIIHRRTWAHLD